MKICEYGCGQEAKHQFKNGKWCCSKNHSSCPNISKIRSNSLKGRKTWNKNKKWDDIFGRERSNILKKRKSEERKGKTYKEIYGEEKGLEIIGNIRFSMIGKNRGKTWESIFGKSKTQSLKVKKSMERKGKTYKEIYGDEKSKQIREKMSNSSKGKNKGKTWEDLLGKNKSLKAKNNLSKSLSLTIKRIKKKYPFFSQIEEMRYNPDKSKEKEIQVRCKNHLCPNSKEQDGWFTPTYIQLYERIRQLENEDGNGGSYFYCSKECKNICPLYYLKSDPLKENEKTYTQEEYQQFREFVLTRDNYECQYCGEKATEVHHERPQKLEPLFVLDPDFAWSCCEECHYKYGHKTGTECSTGNLANKIC
jgi:hypothetical protein